MEEKKAFVFDTNFIVQTKKLEDVIANLSDRFTVYVTQVSVEERIAQQCRELRARYDELEKLKDKCGDIATITIKKSYDESKTAYQAGIQKRYEDAFKEHLIPFSKDSTMFSAVFDRANYKTAPFLADGNASDKGFKDALIWESMLAYFQNNGEGEVLLITDDNGFRKNSESLCAEFSTVTGKKLSIYPNSYYHDLLKPELVQEPKQIIRIPNFEQLREQIRSVIEDLCYVETTDRWGNPDYERTFTTDQMIDADYVQDVFVNLHQVLFDHLFETGLYASAVLERDNRITDTGYQIPMMALENASNLYADIMEKYPEYVNQFFSAVAGIFNQNYQERPPISAFSELAETDGELPF